MNFLQRYFETNTGRPIHKWLHYFEIYERHFNRFRNRPVTVLEIGVGQGGSLAMWKAYFGEHSRIWGLDIREACRKFEEPGIRIAIGDQSDPRILAALRDSAGGFDIVIDDGGHRMDQQITAFEQLYPGLSTNGVYLCEDVHTSYWKNFGGGENTGGSFVDFAMARVDDLNAWHRRADGDGTACEMRVSDFTRTTTSIHFYDSVVVFEKGQHGRPAVERRPG